MLTPVHVWDLPTRIFHWLLAVCVMALLTSRYTGLPIDWHARLGYACLALLLFRLVWGFVGGRWSRFAAFVHSPRAILAYLRGRGHPDLAIGHNPLGCLSVLGMLGILLAQLASGLFSTDEIWFTGPLNHLVNDAQAGLATWYHKGPGQWAILGLILLHVAAIAYHQWKKHNLVKPMLTGDKLVEATGQIESSRDDSVSRWVALGVFCGCVLAVMQLTHLPS